MNVQYPSRQRRARHLRLLAPVSYRRNLASGVAFAANANVSDGDSPNFEGGRLSISVTVVGRGLAIESF